MMESINKDSITRGSKKISQNRRLTKKSSSLYRLAGALIHDINGPLDGAMRYLSLASVYAKEGDILRGYLQEARDGLTRIAKMTRSFSEFCWSLSLNQDKIDVNCIIEECLLMFKGYIISSNIELKKNLSPNLPKLPDYRLKLVFNNIIKNACDAMKDGGTLSIYTARNNGNIEVRFKDTGGGITPENQEKIFETFFTTKYKQNGSGLGLAIAYEIIKRYKGSIFVKNRLGKSTTFVIQLPVENTRNNCLHK